MTETRPRFAYFGYFGVMFWSVNLWGFVMKLVLIFGVYFGIYIAYILTIIYWTIRSTNNTYIIMTTQLYTLQITYINDIYITQSTTSTIH